MPESPERAAAASGADRADIVFRIAAAAALGWHAWLLVSADGLRGGADLIPHLRLMQEMGSEPAIRSVYAPSYHVLGALLAPLVGLEFAPRVLAFVGACAWIFGFRFFQRSFGLPAESSALFALAPYAFGFSSCLPKVEAIGYGFLCVGLGLLHRRRYLGAALVVALTFWVHTASALLLGFSGGVLALASRDRRALVALAGGALLASPLQIVHLAAGCTLAEALRLTSVDYLIQSRTSNLAIWDTLLVIANPLSLVAAGFGARSLWRQQRPVAVLAVVLTVIYVNELWLAPFGQRVALDLLRGLSVLALPVAIAGGVGLAAHRRLAPWWIALCAVWAMGASVSATPRACFTRPISLSEISDLSVARCTFAWRGPHVVRSERSQHRNAAGAEAFADPFAQPNR